MELVEQIQTYRVPLEETLGYESIMDAIRAHEQSLNMSGFSLMTMYKDEQGLSYYLVFKKVH